MSETTNLKLFKHDNPSTNTNQFNVEISLNGNWDKIDEFAGGTDRKIEEAESKTEILEQEYAELKENLDNILPPGQAGPDEDITINDSAKYPCVVEVEGNSWQETREGYNIVKSVRNNTVRAITFNIEKSKITETMYLSLIATENLGTTNRVYFNDTSSNLTAINKGPMDIVANQKAVKQITFTAEELVTLKNSEKDTIMQLYENDTEKDYTAIDFTEVMLSSSNTTNYEEYGASPSTAYPSDLEAVGDNESLKITVSNKNLCYQSNLQNSDNVRFYFNPKLLEKTFTISFIVNADLNSNSLYLRYDGSEDPRVSQITATANTKAVQSITLADDVYNALKKSKTAYFLLYKSNAGFTEVKEAMILNGADTSATYIAHEEQNVTFPFAEGQRLLKNCKLGDTGIIQNRKRIICDGTENWTANATSSSTGGKFRWRLEVADIKQVDANTLADIQCTHYKAVKAGTDGTYQGVEGIATQNTNITIFDPNYATATATEWKAYVAQQYANGTPITIEYELAEPETVTYTEEQKVAKAEIDKLKTYKGVTHITTDSKAILDVSYKKDLEILINNLSNAGEG